MFSYLKRSGTRRPVMGWGISLLAHAAGIVWLWHASPPRPANPDTRPTTRMEVWLLPLTAAVPPRATVPVVASAPSRSALMGTALAPGTRVRPPRPVTARIAPVASRITAEVATPPALSSENDAAALPGGNKPAFDLSAARASARAMVRADVAALPLRQETMKATTSDRIQERFERARRADCLRGKESVNLLANVIALARDVVANAVDDSGCKL